ncbi:MAG: fatty acid desaturase family protein, partial [Planctomycetota bacterium]|nr:fatty acid desaturase family protein [Planctomycetota bacterium]
MVRPYQQDTDPAAIGLLGYARGVRCRDESGARVLGREELEGLGQATWARSALHVAAEWSGVVGAAWAAEAVGPWGLLVSVPWIGARQHALAALAHEGAHGRLFPGRWNTALAEVLCAWPLLMSTSAYGRVHLQHHGHLGTERDPDWVRARPDRWTPRRWREGDPSPSVARRIAMLVGLERRNAGLAAIFTGGRPAPWRVLHMVAVAALVTAAGGWRLVALHWLLPLLCAFLPAMRLRGIAEHWALHDGDERSAARTLLLSAPARWLLLPKNIHYHLEHHLYPSVPFHALPRLHARLMEDPAHRGRAHVTRGLAALAREVWTGSHPALPHARD